MKILLNKKTISNKLWIQIKKNNLNKICHTINLKLLVYVAIKINYKILKVHLYKKIKNLKLLKMFIAKLITMKFYNKINKLNYKI